MKGTHEKRLVIVVAGNSYFYDVYSYRGGGRIVNVRPAGKRPAYQQSGKLTWIDNKMNVCEFYHQKNGDCRRKAPSKEKNRRGVKGDIPYDAKFILAYKKRINGASAVIKTAKYWEVA